MKTGTCPKMYLSTSGGNWRVILQGMPLCKDFDNEADAIKVWDLATKQMGYKPTNDIPVWDGDNGLFR